MHVLCKSIAVTRYHRRNRKCSDGCLQVWAGTVVDAEPVSLLDQPRTVSMVWGDDCDAEVGHGPRTVIKAPQHNDVTAKDC